MVCTTGKTTTGTVRVRIPNKINTFTDLVASSANTPTTWTDETSHSRALR
jgi:hypothetical protein